MTINEIRTEIVVLQNTTGKTSGQQDALKSIIKMLNNISKKNICQSDNDRSANEVLFEIFNGTKIDGILKKT